MGAEKEYHELGEQPQEKSTNCVGEDVEKCSNKKVQEVEFSAKFEEHYRRNGDGDEKGVKNGAEMEKMLPNDLEDMFKDMPLTKDTTCGFWIFKGEFLQR